MFPFNCNFQLLLIPSSVKISFYDVAFSGAIFSSLCLPQKSPCLPFPCLFLQKSIKQLLNLTKIFSILAEFPEYVFCLMKSQSCCLQNMKNLYCFVSLLLPRLMWQFRSPKSSAHVTSSYSKCQFQSLYDGKFFNDASSAATVPPHS